MATRVNFLTISRCSLLMYDLVLIFNESKPAMYDEMFNMLYSRILERIADHTVNICNTLQKGERMEKEQIDALKGFLEFCSELFQKAATLYFNVNLFEVNDLVSKKEMIKEKKEMLSKIRGKNISTSTITEEISRIGMYSTDIAEITMDAHCYRHESTRI